MSMNATLTVKRTELKTKLETRIEEVKSGDNYNVREIQDINKALELLETGELLEEFRARMVAYHQAIVNGLQDGSITISATGKLGGRSVPTKPRKNRVEGYEGWSKENLLTHLRHYESRLEASLQPLRVAIELLDMSSDVYVQIQASDYQSLLSVGRY